MPSSTSAAMTEWALRAAANKSAREITTEGGQADALKDLALQHVQGLGESLPNSNSTQAEAIGIAVAGVAVAYTAISMQLGRLKNQRLDFDKEREAGIATFMIPNNVEEVDLSCEEKVIKGFLDLTMKISSPFSKYLGIHSAELSTDSTGTFYSILPFYKMSEALGQPLASTKPLDRKRTAINSFFKSALPTFIAAIDTHFQTSWKFISFCQSAYEKKNYLNNLRAPRFIMMSLSNLLWNLQHPVDSETGFPLSLTRCIELCRAVELCLNQLLNPAAPPYLQNISNHENQLLSFMRRLEIYTKTLRAAYVEEQLHELNIEEITNSAHQTLRIMDTSVFKLIYKRHNLITNKHEPDEKAAETLADMITYLNELLSENSKIMDILGPVPAWIPSSTGINTPPATVIDVIIIFCHLSRHDRNRLLTRLDMSNKATEIEFAKTLREFGRKFVKPIKTVCRDELNVSPYSPQRKHQEAHILTARRLVPFITLVIEDYRIEVDTAETFKRAKISQETPGAMILYSGKQQAQAINLSAQKGGGYYIWALSPFAEGVTELDKLPKYQYRMTQVTKLMDSVSELVLNYRSFLLQKSFQGFLLKCLSKVKAEYTDLDQRISEADNHLAHNNEDMSRSLQAILRPMTNDLNNSLDAFALATNNFERVVSAPDFTDQQRQLLSTKLGAISEQFSLLFSDDSGLAEFLDLPAMTSSQSSIQNNVDPAPIVVTAAEVLNEKMAVLKKLVGNCYEALSFQSRVGRKGQLLKELLTLMKNGRNLTEEHIKHVVMELTRVTASYRETWFFQAAYGQTSSAKVLIAAIKDPTLNAVLPLAAIIFGQSDINIKQVSDASVLRRLNNLRDSNHRWQEPSSTMRLDWPVPASTP